MSTELDALYEKLKKLDDDSPELEKVMLKIREMKNEIRGKQNETKSMQERLPRQNG